ncbi:MAG: HDOD domain-containing protein [Hahellaceae bacterium]|jgi:HD-like signal output (HDOD) protein|nr:HDOD domain-containing protein [Hahellaceae bacterium]
MKNTRDPGSLEPSRAVRKAIDRLANFIPLNRLSEAQRVVVAARGEFRRFADGQQALKRDTRDGLDYFLIEGKVRLRATDGRETEVAAGSEPARRAIAHLQPRKYDVICRSEVIFLVIDQHQLASLLKEAPVDSDPDQPALMEAEEEAENPAYAAIMAFHEDLKHNRLELPSLPDTALNIRKAIARPDLSVVELARLVSEDVALTVKLIHVANSPFYRGFRAIESCEDAVVRLGITTTGDLITIYTLREMFNSRRPELQERYATLWAHVTEVGALAYVLAKLTPGLKPDQAMLAGIVHDIGAIPVIMYADRHPALMQDLDSLGDLVSELQSEIGSELLRLWGFPASIADAALHADNWQYESGSEAPTYADAVIVAQLHARIGKPGQSLPNLDSVPAFRKLADGTLKPNKSLQVLQMAHQEIDELKALLH